MIYPLMLILAGLVTVIGSFQYSKSQGFPPRPTLLILSAMTIATFIGARLLHIFLNFPTYWQHPGLLLQFSATGLSLFGGLILASLVGWYLCQKLELNRWQLGDNIAPFLGVGIALVRLGCFLNGCCFGEVTDMPWGVEFPVFSQVHKYQIFTGQTDLLTVLPVHPTQLYEMLAALIGSLLSLVIIRKKYSQGIAILVFGLWFTAFRWFDYYLMVRPATFSASPHFYPILYVFLSLLGVTFLIRKFRRNIIFEPR